MKIIHDIVQGTDEWKELRLGKVTASKLADVMSKGRGGAPSKTRHAYMMQLIAEKLTGDPQDNFTNQYMEWGNECEPQARAMYEFETGNEVEEVAFIDCENGFGVSPDGLIGYDGLIEIKCPKTTTQIERYLKGEFPSTYRAQVQGQLLASERQWCDFVSFDPRITGPAQYFCVRVWRDEDYIKALQAGIENFLTEMIDILEKLNG